MQPHADSTPAAPGDDRICPLGGDERFGHEYYWSEERDGYVCRCGEPLTRCANPRELSER